MSRPATPPRIGRFEIRKEIGRGTMGVVYEAHDPVLGRTVALKTIALVAAGAPADPSDFEQRFLAEARIAARLSHPGILMIHEVGRDGPSGTLYMALQYLSGHTLEELLADGRPMEWRQALGILGRVASALQHAHSQGVVHRDVKPANIMLLETGEPKIMDFGIAKLVIEGDATSHGHLLGTPLYMAPEQAQGEAVDARTDIFSLGAIAYSLLTGKRAFQARSIPAILARVVHHDPAPPSTLVPRLPPALDDLVARAMAKDPALRYPSALAMAEDIEDILGGRTPRHRAEWAPPPVGARTLLGAGADEVLDEIELGDAPRVGQGSAGAPMGRAQARPRLLAMILLGGGIGIAAAGLLRFEVAPPEPTPWSVVTPSPSQAAMPQPSAPPPATEPIDARPSELPSEAPSPVPEAPAASAMAGSPTPEASTPPSPLPDAGADLAVASLSAPADRAVATDAVADEGSSSPEPSASPSPRPKEAEKRNTDAKDKAKLSIRLDAALRAKSLRVWVDGKLVSEDKPRPDVLAKALSVSSGRRQVRVEVRSDEGVRAEKLLVTFKAGVPRRLDVKAGRSSTGLAFVLR